MKHAHSIDTPIFLIGSERSGTTLLRLMLDHHPDISLNLESEYLVTRISEDGKFPDTNEYSEWLRHDRVFQHSGFSIPEGLTYKEMVSDFLSQKREQARKNHVGATVHFSFSKLLLIWPKAKFIYLYRDPRDVANSVVQMGWAGNPYVASEWWVNAELEWKSFRQKLGADKWIELGYEDLVSNSDLELQRISQFLDVDFSDKMYEYVENSSYGLPDVKLAYQWKNKMSQLDLQLVEGRIGKEIIERGYDLSGFTPHVAGGLQDKVLHLQSRITCLRHRLIKFGFMNVLQEILSRRLKLGGWHRTVQSRIDAIIDAQIR